MNRMYENDMEPMIWRAHQHHSEALEAANLERQLIRNKPFRWPRLKIEWNVSRPEIEFKIRLIRLRPQL